MARAGASAPFLSACGEFERGGSSVDTALTIPKPHDIGLAINKGGSNYESWRDQLAWHSYVSEREPAMFVRPNNRDQLVAAVQFARANGLRVSTKSGGHNYYESWMRDDCLVLDLYNFRGAEGDETDSTAWVEPSIWSHSFISALKHFKLAFPVPPCLTVSLGGYIMGGGIGFGWQDWGMACDNVFGGRSGYC